MYFGFEISADSVDWTNRYKRFRKQMNRQDGVLYFTKVVNVMWWYSLSLNCLWSKFDRCQTYQTRWACNLLRVMPCQVECQTIWLSQLYNNSKSDNMYATMLYWMKSWLNNHINTKLKRYLLDFARITWPQMKKKEKLGTFKKNMPW